MKNQKGKPAPKKAFPIWAWSVIGVVLLVIVGVFVYRSVNPASMPYPTDISVTQAADKQAKGALVVDVREPDEWAAGHISGAVNIPLGQLSSRLSEVPTDREVVVVCRTGVRSAQGRDILRSAGYEKVTSMTGGITQWQAQGLPLVIGQ